MKSSRIISGICAVVMSASMLSVSASAFELPKFSTTVENNTAYAYPVEGAVNITPYAPVDGLVGTTRDSVKVALSNTRYVYNGKEKKPTVSIKCGTERLRKGIDFDVKYVNNVTPGQASVVITGKNRYCGTKVVNFYIVPKKVSVKVKNYKYNYAGEVYWNPVAYADGYEVQVSTDSGFNKYLRTYDVKDGNVSKAVLFYLNHNKDYYVRVRAYVITPDGNKYGNWSDKTRQRRKGCKCYCWKYTK